MKIAYVANVRMPTEKAHGLQIMHMCRAFTLGGHDVTLIVPKRKNWIEKSIWEFYDAEPIFKIVEVPIVDFIVWDKWLGNFALWFETLWFGMNGRRVIEELAPDVVYSRDPFSSAWTPRWIPHVFESHTFPNRALWLHRWLWKKCDRIVTVTDGLKRMFAAQGVPDGRLRTAADAVDLEAFAVEGTKQDARKKLGLSADPFLVVYAGHLYPYKGIPDLIEACQWLDPSVRVVIVGGRQEDLARTKEAAAKFGLKNVLFIGRVPHKEVPLYLHAADLAVMPYTRESHHVEYYSSPLKLFEYLAAGRAIISTDLPSVREVLDDRRAEFVPPEDPKALSDGINRLRNSPARVAELERSSAELAKLYTWKARARAVLDAMPKPRVEWKLTFYRRYRLEIHLALLALAIRLVYVLSIPQQRIEGGDTGFYLALADWVRGAREFSPTEMTPFYPVTYVWFLAAIRSLFGTDLAWIRAAHACFSAGTVFLMAYMARRWAGPYAAWIAGLIGALYVPMVLETGIIYTETMYTFFLTAGAMAFVWLLERPGPVRALAAGAAFALAGLTREIGLYTGAFVALVATVREWRFARWAAIFLLPMVLMVGLSSWRNRQVAVRHAWGNAPIMAKNYEQQFVNPSFYDNALSPDRWILYPVYAWRFFRYPFRLNDLNVDGVSIKRALLEMDLPAIREHWASFAIKIFLTLFHWGMLLAAAYGVARGELRRTAKLVFLAIIFAAFATISVHSIGNNRGWESLFEPLSRYRFPTEPLILILAATGIERLTRRSAKKENP